MIKSITLNNSFSARTIYRNVTSFAHSNSTYSSFGSTLKIDILLEAEFNLSIVDHLAHLKTFEYFYDNENRKYTPDIFIEYNNGRKLYVEVKYRDNIKKD